MIFPFKKKKRVTYTDEELLPMICGSIEERDRALKHLLTENRGSVFHIVDQMGGNEQDGEDVLQEGVIIFYTNILEGKFQGDSGLSTYFIGICKNLTLSLRRKNSRSFFPENDETLDRPDHADPEQHLLEEEHRDMLTRRRELVEELLKEVTDHCKEVLMLYMQSFSMQKIAALIGYEKESKARRAAYRCRNQLRSRLEAKPQVTEFLKSLL